MLHARRIELEPSFAAKKAVGLQDLVSTKQNRGRRRSAFTISPLTTSLRCLRLLWSLSRLLRCGCGPPRPPVRPRNAAAIAAGGRQLRPQRPLARLSRLGSAAGGRQQRQRPPGGRRAADGRQPRLRPRAGPGGRASGRQPLAPAASSPWVWS